MIMDAVHTDLLQCLCEFSHVARYKRGGNHHAGRGTEIKWLRRHPVLYRGLLPQVLFHDFYQPAAERLKGNEFADIHARQPFCQAILVAGEKRPMRKVVGIAFLDKVVLLERSERELEDRSIRAWFDCRQQLAQRTG